MPDTGLSTTAPTIAAQSERIIAAVSGAVHGKSELVATALRIVLAQGHLLLEDVPGVGKTVLAKALGTALGGRVRRVQCTPDLMPSDITGSSVFDQKKNDFEFRPGPVFANLVIADEINRAEPKTQSALLECMGEQQVTVDGKTYRLPTPFTVVATQNPHEMQGTFALPEAQRDRFMARLSVGYPDLNSEATVVMDPNIVGGSSNVQPVVTAETTQSMIAAVNSITMEPAVAQYLIKIITATRTHPHVALGASTRAAVHLGKAARANAAVAGRSYVLPDDVREMAPLVLAHRLSLSPEGLAKNSSPTAIIREICSHQTSNDQLSSLANPAQQASPTGQANWR